MKTVPRKKKASIPSEFDMYAIPDDIHTQDDLLAILEDMITPTYKLEKNPDKWILPNRAKFTSWLDSTFHSQRVKASSHNHIDGIQLFTHQKFIKDYMQFNSPYRGLLIYHGLGSGKSCSSIAAAEILSNHMDVIVMTPASLRDNYVLETRKCGKRFFNNQNNWAFIPFDSPVLGAGIISKIKLDKEWIAKAGGVWIALPHGKGTPYKQLHKDAQQAVNQQIDAMIIKHFRFINYNGLTLERAKDVFMKDVGNGTRNIFTDKCIVIDEIHNLISQMANKSSIGTFIYKMLMKAERCKLILLSGTPMINYPHEIAILVNLLTGYHTSFELQTQKTSLFDMEAITRTLHSNIFVDHFELDVRAKKIMVSFLPEGFVKVTPSDISIKREETPTTQQKRITLLRKELEVETGVVLKDDKVVPHTMLTLPEDPETFNNYFVDLANTKMRNGILFMRRILGVVSFFNTSSLELYPLVNKEEVMLEMTDYQFSNYEKHRAVERVKEKSKKNNSIFDKVGQVYRFYSRASCNFVFPKEVERPYPSKMSEVKNELDIDIDDNNINEDDYDINAQKPSDKKASYARALAKALVTLRDKTNALELSKVSQYSPKYKAIYDRIMTGQQGNVMIYSQFRKVEGLGLFGMFLEMNGWFELKVVKNDDGELDLNITVNDLHKPRFFQFTGSNEETRMLLRIFNSDISDLPRLIQEKVGMMGAVNNHRGDLIRLVMITKSGAEGISLMNVRQVHVMEPYWNHIRIDQVIGRAVRTKSHIDLPPEDRNVNVYIYTMVTSQKQKEGSFSIRVGDKGLTSDEHIYMMAKKKARIVDEFLMHMKRASVDCAFNNKLAATSALKCFAFPVNIADDKLAYNQRIEYDMFDHQYKASVVDSNWQGHLYETRQGKFLVRPETNEVYDYEIYVSSGRLVKIGELKQVKNKRTIIAT